MMKHEHHYGNFLNHYLPPFPWWVYALLAAALMALGYFVHPK